MTTSTDQSFGALLRQFRQAAGLTQEDLAERAALSPRAVSDLERGVRRAPRRDTVDLLATALALDADDRATLTGAVLRGRSAHQAEQPPPGALDARKPLPIAPTPLVGRDREMAGALDMLSRPEVRLVTLTGPGGVGKTRLALHVADMASASYSDGPVFVPLAPLGNASLVARHLAQALGLREVAGQPVRDSLIAYLHEKHLLLLIDNFEHVLAAAPLVSDLLSACPKLTILATSRAPLRLRGEHVLEVAPLALPEAEGDETTEHLAQSPAVRLFVQRAEAVRPDFALTAANSAAIAAICRRLDGLPLAIELAAARVRLLPPSVLLDRLDQTLSLLTGGARDLPERQQTMRATIAWSYDLLHRGEQALFRRLAVFAGSATLEVIEAVCMGEGESLGGDVIDWLAALLDKSLLWQQSAETDDGEPRLGMLQTVRAYGLERLAQAGEEERTRERHAAYYLGLAERLEPNLLGRGAVAAMEQLESEHDNLRAALHWYVSTGNSVAGLRLGGALWRFWYVRSYFTEGRTWLEDVLALPSAAVTRERAGALNGAGNLAYNQGDNDLAQVRHEECLAIWRALGDEHGIAGSLNNLGLIARGAGDYGRARALFTEAVAINRAQGNRAWEAINLSNLGSIAREEGNVAETRALYEQSFHLFTAIGDEWGIAMALGALGEAVHDQGDLAGARAYYEESVARRRAVGDRRGVAQSLTGLALVAVDEGSIAEARSLLGESLELFRSVSDRAGLALCLEAFAVPAVAQGQHAAAVRLASAAAALRATTHSTISSRGKARLQRALEAAKDVLGREEYEASWQAGQALSPDEAVAAALHEPS